MSATARLLELPAYRRLPLPVVAAEGCDLVLADGRRVLDLYGGHCVNTLGAGDPGLGAVLARQWQRLSFATNLLEHAAREEFLAAAAPGLPPGDWRLFCSNSGAEANENALKMALAATGRATVACFTGAFHGRTAAAAALSEGGGGFPTAPFRVERLPWGEPPRLPADCAAVLVEPIQSLAGVVEPPPGWLQALRAACDARGAWLVFDEVQTGNGRLGSPWAAQALGVVPDAFTTAKGAAGGLPVGLTFLRAELAGRLPAGLLGSTFGGGPLVLAAAAEVARRILAPGFLERVRAASTALRRAALTPGSPVVAVRGRGLLLGLLLRPGLAAPAVRDALLAAGVLAGTTRNPRVLRLTPPLVLPPERAAELAAALAGLGVTA